MFRCSSLSACRLAHRIARAFGGGAGESDVGRGGHADVRVPPADRTRNAKVAEDAGEARAAGVGPRIHMQLDADTDPLTPRGSKDQPEHAPSARSHSGDIVSPSWNSSLGRARSPSICSSSRITVGHGSQPVIAVHVTV